MGLCCQPFENGLRSSPEEAVGSRIQAKHFSSRDMCQVWVLLPKLLGFSVLNFTNFSYVLTFLTLFFSGSVLHILELLVCLKTQTVTAKI